MPIDPNLLVVKPVSELPDKPQLAADDHFLSYNADSNDLQKTPWGTVLGDLTAGWSAQTVTESYNGKLITKIEGYTGGTGTLPDALAANVGKYVADGGYTDNKDNAIDTRGLKGADGKTITTWTAAAFSAGSQVFYNGKIYEASAASAATDIPGTAAVWVEKLSGGANVTTTPVATSTNLVTGNIVANKGIIYNTGGSVADNTQYDAVIIPVDKNTKYAFSGFTKNAGSAMGFYTFDGTNYTLLAASDLAFSVWSNNVTAGFIRADSLPSTGTFITPNKDGVYLVFNTRFSTSNTASTLSITKVVDGALASINTVKDVTFNDAVKKSFIDQSSFTTTSGKNLFNPARVILNWANIYNNYTGINTDSNYSSIIIPVEKNTYYTISGDTVAKNAVQGAQNYGFYRYDSTTGKYVILTDSELSAYTRPDGVTTAKAWFKNVNALSTTILTPNIDGVYLVLNTRFATTNNISTLQVEKGTTPTSYEAYVEKYALNVFGFPLAGTAAGTSSASASGGNQYYNKRIYFFGDSTMTTEVSNLIKNNLTLLQAVNYGSSGSNTLRLSQIIMGTNGFPLPDFTLADAAVFYIGHNDDSNGSISSIDGISDSTTYPSDMWGNIGKSIEFIWSKNTNTRIYICTQHLTDRDAYARSINRAVVLRDIAAYYAVPVIEVLKTSGINKKNLSTMTSDNTHQNSAGAARIAQAMSIGLMSN